MDKFLGSVVKVLLWVWQLPQHLCAMVYLNKPFDKVGTPVRHYERHNWSLGGAVTLGEYIFTNKWASTALLKNEYGHVVQSRILGPIYLFVICLPRIVHCALHKKDKPHKHFYTEKWADRLGGKYFK